MADDATAWQIYFPLAPGVARLAWATEIWGDPRWLPHPARRRDGHRSFRKNLTDYQSQPATYGVYNNDSPAPLVADTGAARLRHPGAVIARTSRHAHRQRSAEHLQQPRLDDGAQRRATHTDGNNVEAGLDLDGVNGVDAPVPGSVPRLRLHLQPAARIRRSTTAYPQWRSHRHVLLVEPLPRPALRARVHRGGAELPEQQLRPGRARSTTASAPRRRTPRGTQQRELLDAARTARRGRMQMYIFTGPTPDRSSALDHDILLHELTHGTSNRLHDNASGLTTTMSRRHGRRLVRLLRPRPAVHGR